MSPRRQPQQDHTGPLRAATPREPVGGERARDAGGRRPARPSRTTATDVAPPRPQLPDDERPQLPKTVRRELQRVLGGGPRAQDVALALSVGSAAIEEERTDVALEMLAWAKHQASRSTTIREAYGIALYLDGDYAGALRELGTYRRLTERVDQNHVIADCLRALGRAPDRIAESARPLIDDEHAPDDRRAEAAIVWAAALADAEQLGAGQAVLRRWLSRRRDGDDAHDLRVRSLAAELAVRGGDHEQARRQLETIAAVDPALHDAERRAAALPA